MSGPAKHVLITGGAGFIGSHLADALLADGVKVRVLDALVPQVHGSGRKRPSYLHPEAELIVGDAGDPPVVTRCLKNVDAVVHFAAAVGVGQSMYEIASYVASNTQATANLLQVLSRKKHTVRKLIVASSMSIYGEGAYRCARCGPLASAVRGDARLTAKQWDMACPSCGAPSEAVPTPETKALDPSSIYAITKRDQEEMCLCVGRAYGLPTVALRFFNVFGERQALSNPYTGVAAIFAARLLNGEPPLIYEDGRQSRDFVHVSDVVQAVVLAIRKPDADYQALNVGTGRATAVHDVAVVLAKSLGRAIQPKILKSFRAGDVRHCVADIAKITGMLGYRPHTSFEEGMVRLTAWLCSQKPKDRTARAASQLAVRGLVR